MRRSWQKNVFEGSRWRGVRLSRTYIARGSRNAQKSDVSMVYPFRAQKLVCVSFSPRRTGFFLVCRLFPEED